MNNHRKRGNRTELEALALFQKKSLKIMTACKIPVLFCCVTPGIPYRRFCVRYSRSQLPVSLFLFVDPLALFVLFLVPWSQKTDNAHAPIGLHGTISAAFLRLPRNKLLLFRFSQSKQVPLTMYYSARKIQLGWLNLPHPTQAYRRQWLPTLKACSDRRHGRDKPVLIAN